MDGREGSLMNPTPDSTLAGPQQIIADLRRKLTDAEAERDEAKAERDEALAREREALDQQTATTEVLGVINLPPGCARVETSNQNNANSAATILKAREAARAKGVRCHVVYASNEDKVDAAFATLVRLRVDALVVGSEPFLRPRRERLVALCERHAMPAVYGARAFGAAGGLISYAPSLNIAFGKMGVLTGKILRGANPATLPIEQPTEYDHSPGYPSARSDCRALCKQQYLRRNTDGRQHPGCR